MINPWNIKSVYELQYFVCPSCVFKDPSKQNIINHAYKFHPESIDYLENINDDSLTDIIIPWKIKNEINSDTYEENKKVEIEKIKDEINSDTYEEIHDDNIYDGGNDKFDENRIDPLITEVKIKSENVEDNVYWSRLAFQANLLSYY